MHLSRFLVWFTSVWLLHILAVSCFAQGQNNVWTFGKNQGIDFNQSPPAFITSSTMTYEGGAAISDKWGNLKFYCGANRVWTANHTLMPNGDAILGNSGALAGSCTQGMTIVPSRTDSNQFYMFTLDAAENQSATYHGYLRYSLVDMSLNGGLGDVVPTQKNIVLDSFTSEQAVAIPAGFCGYWFIVHRNNSNEYRAYKIDEEGLHTTPVISHGIWPGEFSIGTMKVTPDGRRLVLATNALNKIETALFDKYNGTLNYFQQFDVESNRYGLCFSPDGTKLYVSNYFNVSQYDISLLPNIASVEASKYTYPGIMSPYGALRTGPDGRIYISHYLQPYIGTINNPNASGADVDFDPYSMPLPASVIQPGGFYSLGFGNDIPVLIDDTTTNRVIDTILCFESSWWVQASSGYQAYTWNDGSTEISKTISQSGKYWVYMNEDCAVKVDSFYALFTDYVPDLGADSFICINGAVTLDPQVPGASYEWQDGSTGPTFVATTSGVYFVTTNLKGCVASDTITLSMANPSMEILVPDTSICAGIPFTLAAVSEPEGSFVWNDGTTGPQLTINEAGIYSVTVNNPCGTFSDEVTISTYICDCPVHIPTAFSPNGDGRNDDFMPQFGCTVRDYTLSIYNRWGQKIFETKQVEKGWNGYFNQAHSEMT